MQTFYLKWENVNTGYTMITSYMYDGLDNQSNYTLKGWKLHCIASGKSNGFRYLGQSSREEQRDRENEVAV